MKWDSARYDDKCSFVTRYGSDLVATLAPQCGERILDVGCGTGHLSDALAQSGAHVVGIDNSPDMIRAARERYPGLEFVLADAADFAFDEPFDAIFSNAALHWVHRAEEAIVCMARALRPGGRFVVEFGGKGNVQRICDALTEAIQAIDGKCIEAANYFPGIGEYASLLEKHGIEATRAELYERPTRLEDGERGLEVWIRMFRRDVIERLSEETATAVIQRVEQRLREALFRDGAWYADYRRLQIVGRKGPRVGAGVDLRRFST